MKKFEKIISNAVIVETENIDTDQIIPARFLKTTEKLGLGKYMFYNWRSDENGNTKNSIFNDKKSKEAEVLVAGANFGSGSSREHAVWALMDYGFSSVISSEFGDIFYNNSLKNGLLCIKLKTGDIKKIFAIIKKNPQVQLEISLDNQSVSINENNIHFEIDSFRKSCLQLGVDELGYILSHADKIKDFEKR